MGAVEVVGAFGEVEEDPDASVAGVEVEVEEYCC